MSARHDTFRFFLPVIFGCAAAAGIGVRLVYLHLDLVSTKPRQPKYDFTRNIQGRRGTIYGANGAALSQTKTVWDYHVDPEVARVDPYHPKEPIKPEQRLEKMKTVSEQLGLPLLKVMDAYANTRSRFVYLATSDDDRIHDALSDSKRRLTELSIKEKQVRVYPQGERLAHVLGFVSKDPQNMVGGAGLEQRYERWLKGTPGMVRGLQTAIGREVRVRREIDVDARPGCDVHLTIDPNIQYEVEKALAAGMASNRAERAWAIVLSVRTSAILAMVTLPSYDPEHYNKVPDTRRINRAISESYEPGSVMKTITACAAVNEKLVGPETLIDTSRTEEGYYRLPTDHGHKWDPKMSVREALVHSSNIVFGKLGVNLGPERLWTYFTRFGLGRCTGVELPGEETGIIPGWKNWDKVKWSRAPIGQGVAVTALQMVNAYAAIGNDGELLRPYLVRRVVGADGTELYRHPEKTVVGRPITPETAQAVRTMMLGVAKRGGTARRAAVRGYTVAGKTGTAQMKEGRGYSTRFFNASFIGIVPASRPEIAILVTYQKPAFCRSYKLSQETGIPLYNHQGGVCAAPVFRQIAAKTLRYLAVEPDVPDEVPEDEEDL